MQGRILLSLALWLCAADTVAAKGTKTCRRKTTATLSSTSSETLGFSSTVTTTSSGLVSTTISVSSTGTPATPSSSTSSASASTPTASTSGASLSNSGSPTASSSVTSTSASTAATSNSISGTSSTTQSTTTSSTSTSSTISSASSTTASTPSSSTTASTPSSSTASSTSLTTSSSTTSSTTSSSTAPAPTLISPFQLRTSDDLYIQRIANNNNYIYQAGGGNTYVIDDQGYLKVDGGPYVCAAYAYSYQAGFVDCTTTPPTVVTNRRYVSCVQSYTDHAVTCTAEAVFCSPGGCNSRGFNYDTFTADLTAGNGINVYLSHPGDPNAPTNPNLVVPRPVTAVAPPAPVVT